ncbi:MAG: hypothetical protein ACPGTP_08235 [Bacteroidia bacterium]
MKYLIAAFISLGIFACSQENKSSEKADMYEPSELSITMRKMVEFSKSAKATLASGDSIKSVPQEIYDLAKRKGTRDEHEEEAFQSMVPAYLSALKGIERGDSQMYYYDASIQACKTCHGTYCGGPLAIINQL